MPDSDRNPYEVLGVEIDASQDEIKRAFRQLANRYHPDRNGDAAAEDKFKEVAAAYESIGDPSRRAAYDAGVLFPGSAGVSFDRMVEGMEEIFGEVLRELFEATPKNPRRRSG